MSGLKIEALFGGVLALVVLGAVAYGIANSSVSLPGRTTAAAQNTSVSAPVLTASSGQDLICECYNDAFELAGKVKVLSPQYRTGFQQCRARAGVDGGDAWTAGWNARTSSKPYEASCRAYKRRR
ncbi:MAG: hypothetical protein AAGA09_08430 [Pseudomonadota bacterium]